LDYKPDCSDVGDDRQDAAGHGTGDAEYAISLDIETHNVSIKLADLQFADDEFVFADGRQKFPIYSYGPISERGMLVNAIIQDILDSIGCRVALDLRAEIHD
jgi:hypothetical protein